MRHAAAMLGLLLFSGAAAAAEQASVLAGQNLVSRQDARGEIVGWKSFHPSPAASTGDVWTLQPDGVLIGKGKPLGYLYTERVYTNFVLKLQWRWPPGGKAGNGGVLIRTTGPERIWPKSLEAQLNAGQAGDFWGLAGYTLSGPAERLKVVEHPQFGKLTNLRKTADVEQPVGQWNDYEIAAEGGHVTLTVNGQVVNQTTDCEVGPGRILLTAEGDEIHFRHLLLQAR